MKFFNKFSALTAALGIGIIMSCENPELNPNVDFEGSASGFGTFVVGGKPQKDPFNLTLSEPNKRGTDYLSIKPTDWFARPADATMYWASFDKKVKVDKIELYAKVYEQYVDKDGSKALAVHGGSGKLLTTLTAAAMYEGNKFVIDAAKVYDLVKTSTFKYDGTNAVAMFRPESGRTAAAPFLGNRTVKYMDREIALNGDDIEITWKLYGDNGLVYDSWSPSVCEEFVAANCRIVLRVR